MKVTVVILLSMMLPITPYTRKWCKALRESKGQVESEGQGVPTEEKSKAF